MVDLTEIIIALGVCVAVTASVYFLNFKKQKSSENDTENESEKEKKSKSDKVADEEEKVHLKPTISDDNNNPVETLKPDLVHEEKKLNENVDKPKEPKQTEKVKEPIVEVLKPVSPVKPSKLDEKLASSYIYIDKKDDSISQVIENILPSPKKDNSEVSVPAVPVPVTNVIENPTHLPKKDHNEASASVPNKNVIEKPTHEEDKSTESKNKPAQIHLEEQIVNRPQLPIIETLSTIENLLDEKKNENVTRPLIPLTPATKIEDVPKSSDKLVNDPEASIKPLTPETPIVSEPTLKFKNFENLLKNSGFGKIEVTLFYDANRSKLSITLHSAEDLINVDRKGLSDPYVRVFLTPDLKKTTKQKTRVIKDSLNPVWEETFEWTMTRNEALSKTLELNVKDEKSILTKQDTVFLGRITIPLNEIDIYTQPLRNTLWLQPESHLTNILKDD